DGGACVGGDGATAIHASTAGASIPASRAGGGGGDGGDADQAWPADSITTSPVRGTTRTTPSLTSTRVVASCRSTVKRVPTTSTRASSVITCSGLSRPRLVTASAILPWASSQRDATRSRRAIRVAG